MKIISTTVINFAFLLTKIVCETSFGPNNRYFPRHSSSFITKGDFNNDGQLDVAITNMRDSSASIPPGSGNRIFLQQTVRKIEEYPMYVIAADFNHDAKPDLAVANAASDDVSILLGNGTFATEIMSTSGASPSTIAIDDFNNDEKWNLALVNDEDQSVAILLNSCS